MYMQKKSPLTPFLAHAIRKLRESGITNLISKRYIPPEPSCKPLQAKGQPLGMEKFASLFAFYCIGCIISLIILVMENVLKPSKSQKLQNQLTNKAGKKEAINKALSIINELVVCSNDQEVHSILFDMHELLKKI
jgi:hypothetical protein